MIIVNERLQVSSKKNVDSTQIQQKTAMISNNERQPPNLKYDLDPREVTSGEIARGAVDVLAFV